MPRILIAALTLVCAGLALAQDPPAPAGDQERLAAARDLLDVTGVSKQLEGMVDAMKSGFARGANEDASGSGAKMSAEFEKAMQELLRYKEEMIGDFAKLYAEMFSTEEMKTVADFYRSGAGAKFISLTPELMKRGAEIGMKYSDKITKGVQPAAPQP